MKKHQKGFGTVEVLLIIVIVCLIGGGGWYVWQKNQSIKTNQTSTTNYSAQNSEQEDFYSEWKTYKSFLSSGLTFHYPSDWYFTPPTEVFRNVNGGESLNLTLYSKEVQREPHGGGPNPASNAYMCVSITEYGGKWQESDWNLGTPLATEEFKVNGKKLTLATYKGEKPMLGRVVLLENGKETIKTQNNYWLVASAQFNCGQADYLAIENMTEDFSQREETKTAKRILKSIRF